VVDLHTHLVPGVDDGARDLGGAVAVLARFAADGVTIVACTPHLRASAVRRAPPRRHDAALSALQAAAPRGLTLVHGWEVMLDEPGVDLTDPRCGSVGAGGARRVSARPGAAAERARRARTDLPQRRGAGGGASGAVPRVHRRRARPVESGGRSVAGHRRYARRAGAARRRRARPARRGRARRVGERQPRRRAVARRRARAARRARRGDVAALLTAENPARVLRGERPLPVPPLTVRVGVWARLARYVRSAVRRRTR
jgi:protein-tyrosine phosphatase